jgi:hypothetical protein
MPIMIFMTRFYHSSEYPGRFISVSHNNFNIIRLIIFALVVFFVTSCEEGPTLIGSDMLPGSDFVYTKSIDTLSVFSYTMYDDSVRTDNPSVSYLGQIYDPYFGTTTAEFVTQIRMGNEWDDLPFTIDSVKLYLRLLDVKGGTNDSHSIRISEIADQIYTNTAYYSNKKVDVTDYVFPDIDLPELKPDTINEIIIKLPDNILGNYLTRDTAKLFHSNTKADFRSFFKGLYFRILPSSDPLMVALSLASPKTLGDYHNYITLYMHDEDSTAKEFYFFMDAVNKNASFNRYLHDFNTASPDKKIAHINDGYRDSLSYLQYLNGVYTRITLPGLAKLKSDTSFNNIAVNKARLIVPVNFDGDLYRASTIPSQLYLRYRTTTGSQYVVPDYNINASFFDGSIDTTANVYTFNIPSFVQNYLKDAADTIKPELELFQVSGTKNVILKANNSKNPAKFEFTYTKF